MLASERQCFKTFFFCNLKTSLSRVGSWTYSQTLDEAGKACRDKHSSLFCLFVIYEEKNIYNIGPKSCYLLSYACLLKSDLPLSQDSSSPRTNPITLFWVVILANYTSTLTSSLHLKVGLWIGRFLPF